MTWVFVMLGGAAGTGLRYGLSSALQTTGEGFPYGTLTANVLGCFCIGAITAALNHGLALPEAVRLGLTVGVLGGFTTFSSFGLETITMLQDNRWAAALAYWSISNLAGLFAVWCGLRF